MSATTSASPAVRTTRPLIMGRNGAVATNHPLATQAGLDVLRAGGNAIDAAVAIALTLGVVEPHMSGIGGDGFYHVVDGRTAKSSIFNGTGAAPRSATPERFPESSGGIPVNGPLSASTPGMIAGIAAMHASGASRSWESLFEAAIDAASNGFAATHAYRFFTNENASRLASDKNSAATFLGADGKAPALGSLVRQPALAATLKAIACDGAEAFYRGKLAARIVDGLASCGAIIGANDLAGCHAERPEPIAITYRGFEVRQTPPNSMGFTLLQELKIVECFDVAAMGFGSADHVHVLVEAKKRAFRDRERHAADPRHYKAPMDKLLSAEHARAHAAKIDMKRSASLPVHLSPGGGDTTYFAVVDKDGMCVSAIQSLNNAFGSAVTAGDTGILLNNRMAYWHLEEGHPNHLKPGQRVRHTMNAPVIMKDGKPWCIFGTPGADKQVQVNLQVAVAMMDFGLDPQQAIEAPRWSSNQPGDEANYPHTSEDSLTIETSFAPETLETLESRGHKLKRVKPYEAPCSVEAIRILDNGVRMAASDPRRDGWAGAY